MKGLRKVLYSSVMKERQSCSVSVSFYFICFLFICVAPCSTWNWL